MKILKYSLVYILITASILVLMYWLVRQGESIQTYKDVVLHQVAERETSQPAINNFSHNFYSPIATLLLQIITILITARVCGLLFKRIGQPRVIGEVVAGIVLGPSLLGMWLPEINAFLFPQSSLTVLQFFSQMGLILFMFVIGMELDFTIVKTIARQAIIISYASIIIPFTLGMILAYFVYGEFAPMGITFLSFSLFIGITMSITAFPVLARILLEHSMTKTRIGTLALTCAAAGDFAAWCILAVVVSIVKSDSLAQSLLTIVLALCYVILMLGLIKPLLERSSKKFSGKETLSLDTVVLMFGILLLSSYITEVIGIHALFGAFLAGVVMPSSLSYRRLLNEKIEHVSLGLLLPLFFAYSGLRTQIGLLNNYHLWMMCLLIIAVAVIGKFGSSMFTAKFTGEKWSNSIIIGALINTRGLMELIVLNIGYDLGVISSEVFTMMILMALVTTFMTVPVLNLMKRYTKNISDEVV